MKKIIVIVIIGLVTICTPWANANNWSEWNELPTLHQHAVLVKQKQLPYNSLQKNYQPTNQTVITEFKSKKGVYSTSYRRAVGVNEYHNFVSISSYNDLGQDAIGRASVPAMRRASVAPPPPIVTDPETTNPEDRLPLGDGVLPLLLMALGYAVIRWRKV